MIREVDWEVLQHPPDSPDMQVGCGKPVQRWENALVQKLLQCIYKVQNKISFSNLLFIHVVCRIR
jgi:hypothetical protein